MNTRKIFEDLIESFKIQNPRTQKHRHTHTHSHLTKQRELFLPSTLQLCLQSFHFCRMLHDEAGNCLLMNGIMFVLWKVKSSMRHYFTHQNN